MTESALDPEACDPKGCGDDGSGSRAPAALVSASTSDWICSSRIGRRDKTLRWAAYTSLATILAPSDASCVASAVGTGGSSKRVGPGVPAPRPFPP